MQLTSDLINNRRWLSGCLRTLLCFEPPLTITQLREYCLETYVGYSDFDPATGEFGPVASAAAGESDS